MSTAHKWYIQSHYDELADNYIQARTSVLAGKLEHANIYSRYMYPHIYLRVQLRYTKCHTLINSAAARYHPNSVIVLFSDDTQSCRGSMS